MHTPTEAVGPTHVQPETPTSYTIQTEEVDLACGPYFLPPESGFQRHFLQWSQDGSRLIFDFDEAVWVLDVEGPRVRKAVDGNPGVDSYLSPTVDDPAFLIPNESKYGFHANLSPDGYRIVYSTCQHPVEDLPTGSPNNGERRSLGYEIAMINVDGTGQHRLTNNIHVDHYPVWSPDGTQVAFVSTPGGDNSSYDKRYAQLLIMAADSSGRPIRITPSSIQVALYPPVWSPDGQHLAFLAYAGEYYPYERILYTVRGDGSELNRIGKATTLPAWSPDSDQLAFAKVGREDASIYTVSPDGTDLRQIWSSELKTPIIQISWSPDHTELLVVAAGLWAIRPDGSGNRALVSSNSAIWLDGAVWSPDGSSIVARGTGRPPRADYFKVLSMDRDGTNVRLLVGMDVDIDGAIYAWSPPRLETSVDPASCSAGSVIPEPKANRGLVQDCEVLLGIRDMLAGSGSLNWNDGVSILQWQGVVITGSPPRVQRLVLDAAGLTGFLPSQLGQLTELR